jgi:broad specificity phosphatase PhoE
VLRPDSSPKPAYRVYPMHTLILARHGESEYSARGLLNGDASVEVGLTESGEEQARALGRALQAAALDLCVTTGLGRTRRTAELALAGRDVPFETWPELNDPRAGSFEGRHLDDYRGWAWSAGSAEPVPGGGESRLDVVARCARAYRALLERSERTILAVLHALPIAYLLGALDGAAPAARMDRPVEYARAYPVDAEALRDAVEVLEAWCAAPGW